MEDFTKALDDFRKGSFVLVHDSSSREDETDMFLAAEHAKPEDVARMRTDAGGLICLAVGKEIAAKLELPFLSDIYSLADDKYAVLDYLEPKDIKYDKHSAFSISINHRGTFTGITDTDRALTLSEFGEFAKEFVNKEHNKYKLQKEFGKRFRSEGHVPLLLSSGLGSRKGHTELSTALASMAGLPQAAAICEMLDGKTLKALRPEDAKAYAVKNGFTYLEGSDIIKEFEKH